MAQWIKNLPATQEHALEMGSISGLGRSPGGGHSNPLQYSCLENPMGSEPGRLQSTGRKESDTTEVTEHSTSVFYTQHFLYKKIYSGVSTFLFILTIPAF